MTIGEYVKKPTEMEQVSSFSTGSGALLGKQLVKSGKLTEGDVLRIIDVQRMNNLRYQRNWLGHAFAPNGNRYRWLPSSSLSPAAFHTPLTYN